MSWIQKLYDTYENCQSLIGKVEGENLQPLMPVYHITMQAQIEVVIDTEGCWRSAKVLEDKNQRTTLIPCTESSAARSGTDAAPHPFFDKLMYLAKDYTIYRQSKKERFTEYIAQLTAWCDSPYAHPKVCAVLKYLKKGCLMQDLISTGVLYRDNTGDLPKKWNGDKNDTPPIFKAVTDDQANAFIRFQVVPVDGSEDLNSRIWEDPSVWQSYINYQNSLPTKQDFCYVLGKKIPVSKLSPKYIRRPGDGAKLISANDSSGFTYRGRFDTSSQAFCIGRETTEKAHNALKWLIPRQAYVNSEQVILAWRPDGGKTLNPCDNSLDTLDEKDNGRTLAVACALVRKYHNDDINRGIKKLEEYKERWKMALDTKERDRNYLFGRALAYAEMLENYALNLQNKKQSGDAGQSQDEKRSTNAERLQVAFSQHPARTWETLYHALLPYLERLGQKAAHYREELDEIISNIDTRDFTNEPLNEIYLLGYACQMQKFREDWKAARQNKNIVTDMEGDE